MSVDVLEKLAPSTLRTADGAAEARLTADGLAIEVSYHDGGPSSRLVLKLEPSRGVLTLAVPDGDLRLEARRGSVEIAAARDIELSAQKAECRVGLWKICASQIRQRAESIVTQADSTLQVRAGRVRNVVSGMFQLLSGQTSIRSKDNTAIDGKRILMG